jgi:hypothetical protein
MTYDERWTELQTQLDYAWTVAGELPEVDDLGRWTRPLAEYWLMAESTGAKFHNTAIDLILTEPEPTLPPVNYYYRDRLVAAINAVRTAIYALDTVAERRLALQAAYRILRPIHARFALKALDFAATV